MLLIGQKMQKIFIIIIVYVPKSYKFSSPKVIKIKN